MRLSNLLMHFKSWWWLLHGCLFSGENFLHRLLIFEVQPILQTLSTVFWDQQEIFNILPTLIYKSTLMNESVKNQKIKLTCNLIHQYILLLDELINRMETQLVFGCLANYHKLLNDCWVKGYSCLFFEEIQQDWKWLLIRVAYKT